MSVASVWASGDYGVVAARIAPVAERLVRLAHARAGGLAGRRVVDLACGTGNAALLAARAGAYVEGVDITPELLAVAAARAQRAALPVGWHHADASATELPPGADVVLSCMGMIFVPDPDAAAAEASRLLTPGGVLALSAWEPREHDPMSEPLLAYLPDPPPAASPLDWGRRDELERRLSPYVDDLEITLHVHEWRFDSVAEAVALVVDSSPLHVALQQGLDADGRAGFRAAFSTGFAALAGTDGRVAFSSPYVVATGLAH